MRPLDDIIDGKGLLLLPGEKMTLDVVEGSFAHNPFAKVSLSGSSMTGLGMKVSDRGLEDGDEVVTAWPESMSSIPGVVAGAGVLELAGAPDEGKRCFVLDKGMARFITVSMPSDGTDRLRIYSPAAIDSWMVAAGSRAMRAGSDRFDLERTGRSFAIKDSRKGKRYIGTLLSDDDLSIEHEAAMLKRTLSAKGLGAILPIYKLRIEDLR